MHLIALVDHADHVCCRYRLAAFRPLLESAGHQLELRELPRGPWARLRLFRALRGANVVVQRKLLSMWERVTLRRSARRLLFDFDDAVFLRDSYSPRGLHDPRRRARFAAQMRCCDAIVAGNGFLAAAAAAAAPAARVRVIPTSVDPSRYPRAEHRRRGAGVRLVWIGSASTLQGLQRQIALLEAIGRATPGLELHLVCDRYLQLEHLRVVPVRWSAATEGAALASADIGISWIPDDDWSRGKCALKLVQYLAAGLPVVTNPVGAHQEVVTDGVHGFLADTPGDWVEAIARLAGDPALRQRLGEAGRRRVEADYSVAASARRWLALLDELAEPAARVG